MLVRSPLFDKTGGVNERGLLLNHERAIQKRERLLRGGFWGSLLGAVAPSLVDFGLKKLTGGRQYRSSSSSKKNDLDDLVDDVIEETAPSRPSVPSDSVTGYVGQKTRSGVRRFVDNVGDALSNKVMPVIIDRLIGSILGRVQSPPKGASKQDVIKGGAAVLCGTGRKLGMNLPQRQIQKILSRYPKHKSKRRVKVEILPYIQ